MDLSCIISSGDLELYILGLLPEEEAYKIAQLVRLFPEIQQEIDRISESLIGLGSLTTVAPSPSVKDNLMGRLRQLKTEKENSSSLNLNSIQGNNKAEKVEAPVISLTQPRKKNSWMVAASLIGLIICLGALIYVTSQYKRSGTELVALKQQVDTLHTNINVQQNQILAYEETLQMMHDNSYKKIALTNVPGKPLAMAQVFWDTKTKYVYIADVSLPQAPPDKQYQLWAIVDGKPVDAGMLSDTKNLAQKMKVFEKAEMFAITLEKKGGNPTPTMEQMYVAGKV